MIAIPLYIIPLLIFTVPLVLILLIIIVVTLAIASYGKTHPNDDIAIQRHVRAEKELSNSALNKSRVMVPHIKQVYMSLSHLSLNMRVDVLSPYVFLFVVCWISFFFFL